MDRKSYLELCELYLKTYSLSEVNRQSIYHSIVDLYDSSIPAMGSEDDATSLIGEPKSLVATFVSKFKEVSVFDEEYEEEVKQNNNTYEKSSHSYSYNSNYSHKSNGFITFLRISALIFIFLCILPFVLGWLGALLGFYVTALACIFTPVAYILFTGVTSYEFVWFFFFLSLICSGISFMSFFVLNFLTKYTFKACGKFFSFFKS